MVKSKESPKNRRKSIAVPNRKKPVHQRKRAHSVAPGGILSPRARARRVLVPRKSILKSSINVVSSTDQSATNADATQSLEFTKDYHAPQTTFVPRKSLGRRVSFAQHAFVKVFEKEQNTNESESPASSPASSPNKDDDAEGQMINDENAYPGAKPIIRRRSIRRSFRADNGEEEESMDMDMDDTGVGLSTFLRAQEGSANMDDDESFEEDGYDAGDDNMDMTEAIRLNIQRRRTLSLGRRRLSVAATEPQDLSQEDQSAEQSYEEENSAQSQGDNSTQSQSFASESSAGESQDYPVEYTVPLSRSVRAPRPPSDIWLALRAMTHSGDTPYEPEDPSTDSEQDLYVRREGLDEEEGMELTDALSRLKVARESLGIHEASYDHSIEEEQEPYEDSFTESENSFNERDGHDMGNHTLNLTNLVKRASLGQVDIGMGEQDLRESDQPVGSSSAPGKENELPPMAKESPLFPAPTSPFTAVSTASTVFSHPSPFKPSKSTTASSSTPQLTVPRPFSFSFTPSAKTFSAQEAEMPGTPSNNSSSTRPATPSKGSNSRPSSPSKSKQQPSSATKPTFSAAFAPPVSRKSLKTRANPEDLNASLDVEDQPSSAKKPNLGSGKPLSAFFSPLAAPSPRPNATNKNAVGRLSPSKKALFEKSPPDAPINTRTSVGMRRPPGYFAQRRSMGAPASTADANGDDDTNARVGPSTDKKAALARLGRASVGSAGNASLGALGPTGVINSDVQAPAKVATASSADLSVSPPEPPQVDSCEREKMRQAIAIPSHTRGSPSPASLSPRPSSPFSAMPAGNGNAAGSLYPALPPTPSPVIDSSSPRPTSRSVSPLPAPPDMITRTQNVPRHDGQDESMIVDATHDRARDPTAEWVKMVQAEEAFDEDDLPPISIEQFFAMTGIKFMDELTVPRRSTFHRAGIKPRIGRSSTSSDPGEDVDIPLAEYVVAMTVDIPQLEQYSHVAQDLQAWIDHSKTIFKQAEEECSKVAPELFREYFRCSEEDRPDFQQSLKLIKTHAHASAKSQWYEWKLQWVEQLQEIADQGFVDMEADAKMLETITSQAQDIIPSLRDEYERITQELEQEQREVTEIEQSDQVFLGELKHSISEQTLALDVYRTDISENRAKLERLRDKLTDIELQKRESTRAIADSERIAYVQKNSTKAEVFRLKDELEALQDLHLWRPSRIQSDLVELVYDFSYLVSIPCVKFKPLSEEVHVVRTNNSKRRRDDFPKLTEYSFKTGRHRIMSSQRPMNVRQIVQTFGDLWSSCAQLRQQFTFLSIKFPTSIQIGSIKGDNAPDLNAVTTILFPGRQAKAFVIFVLNVDSFRTWPESIASIKCEVEVAYGSVERDTILNAVMGRLGKATPADNHGCLLDACIEAMEQYD